LIILISRTLLLAPSKIGLFIIISQMQHPKDHISMAVEYSTAPSISSGLL
jgi:hypothetical protein